MAREKGIYKVSQNRAKMPGDQSCCFSCAVHNDDLEGLKHLLDSCILSDSQVWYLGCDLLRKVAFRPDRVNKFLLESDAKANSESESKCERPLYWNGTPLRHAVGTDSIDIMKSLLQVNRDVDDPKSHDNLAPLRVVAQLGNTQIGELLLDHIYRRKTPSRCAVVTSNLETVKSLLQASVDANETLYGDSTAFEIATQLATREISNLLNFKNTWLYIAVEENNTSLIRTLLQQNADVEARSHNDLTPLHVAAQLGNTKCAEILLQHGADTNSVCASALCMLLDAAVRKERKALVELLLKRAAIVNVDNDGMLLDLAATRNHRAVVKLLLNDGIDIDARVENNKNMLRLAVKRWNLPLIEKILEARSDLRNNRVDTQGDMLEALLRHGFRVGSEATKDCILLHYAIRSGYLKIVEYLLNLGTDCNAKCKLTSDSTFLHTAIAYKHIEIARRLIEHNADVNAKDGIGRTPLHYVLHIFDADNKSMTDIIAMLLVSEARVDERAEDGKTALQIAANEGYEKVVELLLEHKADVNSVDDRMETPLHSSARSGNPKTIKILLDNGATVNAKRNDGATALHVAVKRGQAESVKLLIDNGADTATRDRFGVTPLHIAVTGYSAKLVEILLNSCDDVDRRDEGGRTALHFAAVYGSFTFVRALLDHGADIHVLCNDGFTPVDSMDDLGEWDNHINSDYYVVDDSRSDRSIMDYIELYSDRKETKNVFVEHIAKMTALSRWVSEQNFNAIECYDYQRFDSQCAGEVECMRQKKIGHTNVSYYEFLTVGMNSLSSYARNKYIAHALERREHKDLFPLYSGMLHKRFKNGQRRAGLLDSSWKSLSSLTGHALPDHLTMKLLGHLSQKDLINLVKAGSCDN